MRSNRPEVFLGKGVPKICSKFTGEHPCRCAIEITHLHGCSVNLQRIFVRIPLDGRFFNVFLLPLKAHSQNWDICGYWKSFKNDENAFYFALGLFVLTIFKFFSWLLLSMKGNDLIRKLSLISKFMTLSTEKQIFTIHVLPNI